MRGSKCWPREGSERRLKLAICNEMFEERPIGEVIDFVAGLGYEGIELAPFTLAHHADDISADVRNDIKKRAADTGIDVVGLHWLLITPPGLHIGSKDPEVRRDTIDYLRSLARLCADVSGQVMVFGSPNQRNVPEDGKYDDTWMLAVDTIRQAGETCRELGVVLAMEPLRGELANFLQTAAECRKFIDEVDLPSVKMTLDCYSMNPMEESIPAALKSQADVLAHVHLNDDTGREPGTGTIDFAEVGQALRAIDYQGFASIEVFEFEPDAETIARRGIEHVRRTFGL